jgi:hypothetical protein
MTVREKRRVTAQPSRARLTRMDTSCEEDEGGEKY